MTRLPDVKLTMPVIFSCKYLKYYRLTNIVLMNNENVISCTEKLRLPHCNTKYTLSQVGQ